VAAIWNWSAPRMCWMPTTAAPQARYRHPLARWTGGVELSGRTLDRVGVQAPVLFPERLVLIRALRS
jgi:alpha-galactosidase